MLSIYRGNIYNIIFACTNSSLTLNCMISKKSCQFPVCNLGFNKHGPLASSKGGEAFESAAQAIII
jgi:hypothetical protein